MIRFTVTKYPQGAFSWVDCSTSDADARHFYASLLGWDIEEAPMGGGLTNYTFLRDGHRIAALSELPPQMAHLPPSWNSYVTVDDVDVLAPAVQKLGGTVLVEPFDISDNGRLLMCQDPQGAAISFWQPINHIGAGLVNTPGALSWNELWTADLPSSKAFYGALLGWAFEAGPGVPVYTTIWNQGRRNGGILSMDEDMAAETPPMWVPHVSVADIEAAARRVVQLGGTVHVGPRTNADANRWLLFADPQGALCYLMQLNNPEPWLEHSS